MEARKVELLTQMGWWSEANLVGSQFTAQYPNASQTRLVNACRAKALRNLAFLALEEENKEDAHDYLEEALKLDPKRKVALHLRPLTSKTK